MSLKYDDFIELAHEHYPRTEHYEEVHEQLFGLLVDAAMAYAKQLKDGHLSHLNNETLRGVVMDGLSENLEMHLPDGSPSPF